MPTRTEQEWSAELDLEGLPHEDLMIDWILDGVLDLVDLSVHDPEIEELLSSHIQEDAP